MMKQESMVTIPLREYEKLKNEQELLEEIKESKTTAIMYELYKGCGYNISIYHKDSEIVAVMSEIIAQKEAEIAIKHRESYEKSQDNSDLKYDIKTLKNRGFWARVFNIT